MCYGKIVGGDYQGAREEHGWNLKILSRGGVIH